MKNLNYCHKCGNKLVEKQDKDRVRFRCSKCQEFRYRNAVPVAGVFVVKKGEILLIKRGGEPNKNTWSYPAGHLEYDEKPETGAARELEEETNLKADEKQLELITTILLEHPDKYVVGNTYSIDFKNVKGQIKPGSDAKEAKFWTIKEMKDKKHLIESEKIIKAAKKAINQIEKH